MSDSAPVPVPVPPELFCILRADLRYFDRRPKRRHRLRLAALCEIEEARCKVGLILPPAGVRVFCGIHRLSPGSVHRVVGFAVDVGEVDFDEKTAARAYARLAPQDVTTRPDATALWHAVPAPSAIGG
ncbi:hypothetical protein MBRA_06402 [Methylobacterium brachiatum]|jgi:hypothetical protein|nr:hypothetical protein MBRA_06402 [Methylobacterium brachiatum]